MLDESTARVVLDVLKKYVSYEPRLMALLVELEQQRDLRLLARDLQRLLMHDLSRDSASSPLALLPKVRGARGTTTREAR